MSRNKRCVSYDLVRQQIDRVSGRMYDICILNREIGAFDDALTALEKEKAKCLETVSDKGGFWVINIYKRTHFSLENPYMAIHYALFKKLYD